MAKRKSADTGLDSALSLAMAAINKEFGSGALFQVGSSGRILSVPKRSSGSPKLDRALGGGYPEGRIIEIFGPESCLDSESFIRYEVRMPDGSRANHKGSTIERLWERFHGESAGGDQRGKYLRPETIGASFFAPCMNEEGRIFTNKILDVVRTGTKDCFRVTTLDGYEIMATAEHRFLTRTGFVELQNLDVGMVVMMHKNTPFKVTENETDADEDRTYRKYLFVQNHPIAGIKAVGGYSYHRLANARAVYEAHLNHLSLEDYVAKLNNGNLDGLVFLDRSDHVHHIDEDITNDRLDNLVLISSSEHGKLHARERHNNLRFMATGSVISSIEPVGPRSTYDIRMESPFNNFVANNFIVHNSGKTTLCLHAIKEAQAQGKLAVFIDAEHALDIDYAAKLGVDVDKLLVSQPTTGEEALNIADMLVRTGSVGIIVIDSVAALVPKAELEGDIGDSHVGLQSRMMSQALRMLIGKAQTTGTIVMFTNQIRMKIGVMFGNQLKVAV